MAFTLYLRFSSLSNGRFSFSTGENLTMTTDDTADKTSKIKSVVEIDKYYTAIIRM